MYILKCANDCYYTGSTNDLEIRLEQHQNREGANFTKKHLPVEIVYYEEFQRIDEAYYREKQVQGWSRKKKEALINSRFDKLSDLSKNHTQFPRTSDASTGSATEVSVIEKHTTTHSLRQAQGTDDTVAEPVEATGKEIHNE
jgi:putative endonuclease